MNQLQQLMNNNQQVYNSNNIGQNQQQPVNSNNQHIYNPNNANQNQHPVNGNYQPMYNPNNMGQNQYHNMNNQQHQQPVYSNMTPNQQYMQNSAQPSRTPIPYPANNNAPAINNNHAMPAQYINQLPNYPNSNQMMAEEIR